MLYLLFLHAGWGGRAVGNPSIILQRHNKDLDGLLHELLPVVREEQVVVWDTVAHRIIGTHHIQQRGEQRQSMSRDKDMDSKVSESFEPESKLEYKVHCNLLL